ncbi:MFS transporter [Lacticaseibacillus nasuensis]|uniref:MFS transporter n=1 Tax=Lacticaseibacillus nasuensis TaxID=944671 RepID=UPI0022457063|nr:MFS transporter [Lacticaseibacillus nasuensis]MCX2456445.1 MFS transporter [Lacticaseibacillus nasuensis]
MRTPHAALTFFLGFMSLLTGLSGSSTTLALPVISREFGVSNAAATWVVNTGLITTTILLVMFGHIGDLLGKSTIFVLGGGIFVLGSLFVGIAPWFWAVLAGRFVQAVGIAMIMANSMGIVSDAVPDRQRAETLAIISMFISVGSISGPALGGLLISVASWRWIYLLNVPLGLIALWLGARTVPLTRPSRTAVGQIWRAANWAGQNLFTAGILLFFGGGSLLAVPSQRWLAIGALLVGAGLTVYSFVQDDHANTPWIAPSLLRNPDYMISVSTLWIVMLINAVSNILLPFYLQSYLGVSAWLSGLTLMIQSVVMLLVTPLAGYLADHWNRYNLTILGLLALIGSQIGYACYPGHLSWVAVLWPIVLNGVGMALFLSPNNALTMAAVPPTVAGVAGSLNSFARTFGMTIGISFGAQLLFAQLPGVKVITPQVALLPAFANVFWLGTALSLLGLGVVIYRRLHAN